MAGQLNIPVFVSPTELLFNIHDRGHHKQMITITNPYDFRIRYKILSTSPDLFTITEFEGSISSGHTYPVVVCLLSSQLPTDSPIPVQTRLRVQIYDARTKQAAIGRKDLTAKVSFTPLETSTSPSGSMAGMSGSFQKGDMTSSSSIARDLDVISRSTGEYRGGGAQPGNNINYVAIVTGIVCIIALCLPSEKEPSTLFPVYLHLSLNQKLLLAYTLGLVTMVIFRP